VSGLERWQVRKFQNSRRHQVLAAQVELLYTNANVAVAVTWIAVAVLSTLEWGVIRHSLLLAWCVWMVLVSGCRYFLVRQYRRQDPSTRDASKWGAWFTIGAGLSGAGWGAAGIWLFPEPLASQIFLIFVLGGMMLGACSLLSPWRAAFLVFLIPTGLGPAIRLALQGDEAHLAMGLLAAVFTVATLGTTYRIHQTILSGLSLQFENQDLVEDLRVAKTSVESLNEDLELRVRQRTAELQRSTEQLRAEISQREQVEEELLRARKLESLGVLAGGIAHDFNNFLTVVLGNVELAKMQLDPLEPVQGILSQTAAACEGAVFLSSQLLTFAKGGAPVRCLVSVSDLVRDAVELARSDSTSISVTLDDDLRYAEVDRSQIGQVLQNILLNARQAMPSGGIIEVHAENLGGAPESAPRVRISVRDYGCGIPEEARSRVFDPYFTTKPGGSGLGLATAYAIVAKHGGTISVESEPGRGSVFHVDLPASIEKPATETPAVSDSAHETPTVGERLLVMDDDHAIRKLLATVLIGLGYWVETARDGAEAIALYEEAKAKGRPFDAILLDLTVKGGMGGVEAAARLRELDPFVRLIVSSGYSDDAVLSDYRKYGFDEAIPKPWTATQMGKVFRRVLVPHPDRKRT